MCCFGSKVGPFCWSLMKKKQKLVDCRRRRFDERDGKGRMRSKYLIKWNLIGMFGFKA